LGDISLSGLANGGACKAKRIAKLLQVENGLTANIGRITIGSTVGIEAFGSP